MAVARLLVDIESFPTIDCAAADKQCNGHLSSAARDVSQGRSKGFCDLVS